MKRREEIERAANQKYPYGEGTKGLICENSIPIFIQGTEWADKTMIEKVCNIFCRIGCPHKIDSYNCLKTKCIAWKTFRKMMEE